MKLNYSGTHLKVYNLVARANQIISSVAFQQDLRAFLNNHYADNVVDEFLSHLQTSGCDIKITSHWKPFSQRVIYVDKAGLSINSARLKRPSKFYISLLLERAFIVFDQKYDISEKTLKIKDIEEKEDVLQGIGYLAQLPVV
ncbi:hypothetical protein [Zunongwangia pacifica]|uniref:Uncharacterized protein n=1 Tax=Zunongwangia pacifica TaxID=2911062 RepID=A0A9X1ZS58_9FLAO|nr:hypothetical protein [Zunongwangia pacifica]MCL6220042.1 hypothetical protein [Zunongwangia pacifica]